MRGAELRRRRRGRSSRTEIRLRSSTTVHAHGCIEPLAEEWTDLADRVEASPWLRPGWFAAWRRSFGRGRITILTLRRSGQLIGVVSLERRFGGLVSMSNWHTPTFSLLADGQDAARELALVMFGQKARRISLGFVALDDPWLEICRSAAAAGGRRTLNRPLERSPYVLVEGDWAEYESRRDTKLLRELRRRRRRLGEQGRLSLEVSDGSARLEQLLDEGFRVEAAAWKGRRGTAIASHPATARFYREVGRWAAAHGWLRLAFLRLDGRPLAFDYCIEDRGVHYLLKTGYDPAYRAFSPGILLRREMLARAFSAGLARYEFLGDAAAWKFDWAERWRDLRLLQGFAPSPLGAADWAAMTFGRPLAKRLLRRPVA